VKFHRAFHILTYAGLGHYLVVFKNHLPPKDRMGRPPSVAQALKGREILGRVQSLHGNLFLLFEIDQSQVRIGANGDRSLLRIELMVESRIIGRKLCNPFKGKASLSLNGIGVQ